MQPRGPLAWVSAPVDRLRRSTTTASLATDVAYTLRPSGLTATELGPISPRTPAHPPAPFAAMQPALPLPWVSLPVRRLRRNTAMALLREEATYTFWPPGLAAMAREPRNGPGPSSARAGVQRRRARGPFTRHPPAPRSWVSSPVAVADERASEAVLGPASTPATTTRVAKVPVAKLG